MFSLILEQSSQLWELYKRNNPAVSATEISSVIHMNPYKSRRALYLEKTGRKSARTFTNEAMENGKKQEPAAIHWLGWHYWRRFMVVRPGIVLHPDYPCAACSPDALITDSVAVEGAGEVEDSYFGLEVKCPWTNPIPQQPDEISAAHILQAFYCLHLCQARYWILYYFDWENPQHTGSRMYLILPDVDIFNKLYVAAQEFMAQVLKKNDELGLMRKTKWDEIVARSLLEKIRVIPLVTERMHQWQPMQDPTSLADPSFVHPIRG